MRMSINGSVETGPPTRPVAFFPLLAGQLFSTHERISYTALTALPQLLTGKVERLVRARLQWSVMKGGFDASRSEDTATSWVEYKDKKLPSSSDQPKS